jgi:hypothetical protein
VQHAHKSSCKHVSSCSRHMARQVTASEAVYPPKVQVLDRDFHWWIQ